MSSNNDGVQATNGGRDVISLNQMTEGMVGRVLSGEELSCTVPLEDTPELLEFCVAVREQFAADALEEDPDAEVGNMDWEPEGPGDWELYFGTFGDSCSWTITFYPDEASAIDFTAQPYGWVSRQEIARVIFETTGVDDGWSSMSEAERRGLDDEDWAAVEDARKESEYLEIKSQLHPNTPASEL